MKEDFLHYVWKTKNFNLSRLYTVEGQPLFVHHFGNHNHDAGPDFLDAKIEIDGYVWVGHVEIHINASDWKKHGHSDDEKYQNVILHVVFESDRSIKRQDATIIPCLEMKGRIPSSLLGNYHKILHNTAWIPCQDDLVTISSITKQHVLDVMIANRLSDRSKRLRQDLDQVQGDWDTLCYHRLAWAMGLRVNADSMLSLLRSIPISLFPDLSFDAQSLEALLFGQAGLLPEKGDKHVSKLNEIYTALRSEYSLQPRKEVEWKFSRMRPTNFPTIRIAQLAILISTITDLKTLVIQGSLQQYETALDISAGEYWNTHYRFNQPSKQQQKKIGRQSVINIIVNAFIPLKYFYGQITKDEELKEAAINILEHLPSEQNSVTKKWSELKFPNRDASDSQGLIELKKTFCDQQRCLTCPIGHKILTEPI